MTINIAIDKEIYYTQVPINLLNLLFLTRVYSLLEMRCLYDNIQKIKITFENILSKKLKNVLYFIIFKRKICIKMEIYV